MSTVQDDRAAPNKNRTKAGAKPARSGSESRKLSKLLIVRYTPADYAELEQKAHASGLRLASYVRLITNGTKPEKGISRKPTQQQLLASDYLAQLAKIGSNINQIARAANMNQAGHSAIEIAFQDINALVQLCRRILRGEV